MSRTASFPSDAFPAYPSISLDLPDGWDYLPVPAALLAVGQHVPDGQFTPNVVVGLQRLRLPASLAPSVTTLIEAMEALPEYAEAGREARTLGPHDAFRIEGSYRDPSAGTLYQAVWLALVVNGPVADIVQLTASCHASQVETSLLDIRHIQSTASIKV